MKSLKYNNLKVAIFNTARSFTRLTENFGSGRDMRAYLENDRGHRVQQGEDIWSQQ